MNIINTFSLSKTYTQPQGDVSVFSNISLTVKKGSSVAILGESGRGKTTLLYLLSGLDKASSGTIVIDNNEIQDLTETELAFFRAQYFGFVFQHHFLLSDLSALDNAVLPLRIANKLSSDSIEEVKELFSYLGVSHRINHLPDELSGGEKQRISLIRALANKPLILFADEPTGSLDKENSEKLAELLFSVTKKEKTTLILSTHNQQLAQQCDYKYTIDELEVK